MKNKQPQAYRVLSPRFVLPGSIMGERTPLTKGDVFSAIPCALLRRAVRDNDLEVVVQAAPRKKEEK